MLDVLVAAILLLSTVWAIYKGFVKEGLSLIALVLGIMLAASFYHEVGQIFGRWIDSPFLRDAAGFICIFILVLLVGGLLIMALNKLLDMAKLKWVDRLIGGLFGLIRGWLIGTVVVMAMVAFGVKPQAVERSFLAPHLLMTGRLLVYAMPAKFRQQFETRYREVYNKWVEMLDQKQPDGDVKNAEQNDQQKNEKKKNK